MSSQRITTAKTKQLNLVNYYLKEVGWGISKGIQYRKNCPKGIVQGKPWGKNELVLSTNRNILAQAIPYRKTKNNAESETRKKFQAPKIPYAPPEKKNLLNSSVDPELLCLRSLLLFD